MDKAPAYGAGDSGFESQYGLTFFFFFFSLWPPCRATDTPHQGAPAPPARGQRKKTCAGLFGQQKREGVMRESNSRPPAPEAGIIPLDQSPYYSQSEGKKKPKEGRAGVEPATYRAATDCSTTELMPLNMPVAPTASTKKISGGAGYRSLCLLHAKQALYHLSYTPMFGTHGFTRLHQGPPVSVRKKTYAPTGSRTRR